MAGKRRSLGVKIAVANSLLAVFLVSAVVALVHRKDRRLLEANIRRELTQMVAVAALLLEGSGGEALGSGPQASEEPSREFRSLQNGNPAPDPLHGELLEMQGLGQELSLAGVILQSLPPTSCPRSSRCRTNARRISAQVAGGDFYGFLKPPRDRLGIVVDDVAGRGVAAAVYMACVVSNFPSCRVAGRGSREALERLNPQFLGRSTRGMFVTLSYLVLDTVSRELWYSSSGHLPPLRCRGRTGAVELLEAGRGVPLDIAVRPGLIENRLEMETRILLLLVADGVVEELRGNRQALSMDPLVELFVSRSFDGDRLVDNVIE